MIPEHTTTPAHATPGMAHAAPDSEIVRTRKRMGYLVFAVLVVATAALIAAVVNAILN